MPRKLPPLNSLKSFEAAGRLLSFTGAAAELNVTQAAVSHQIKIIEEYIGAPLFIRSARRLTLTEEGNALLPSVTRAFDGMSKAMDSILLNDSSQVRIRLAPTFAAKWLSPKLASFHNAHPNIELSLFHSQLPADFDRDNLDIAITFGAGDWKDVIAEPILALDFFPVCSPSFMETDKPLTDPDNLRYYTLLHDMDYSYWQDWIELAGLEEVDSERGMIIDDTNVLIQAAIDGQGVALGSHTFVDDHLRSGALVKPFEIELQTDSAYHLVYPETHLQNNSIRAFRDWLIAESDFG